MLKLKIIPRLKIEVEKNLDNLVLVTSWIFPWNDYMPSKYINNLFLYIFQQISKQFHRRELNNLFPFVWIEKMISVQLRSHRNNVLYLFTKITPRLQEALKNCLKHECGKPSLFVKVQKWENLLMHEQYVNLIQRFFFPKWIYLLLI